MSEETSTNSSYEHIIKYTGIFGGIQGMNILVALLRNKIIAVLLGPNGMGLISLFNSTVRVMSDGTGLGIPISGVRNISEALAGNDDAHIQRAIATVRLWSLLTAVVGTLLTALMAPLLDRWTFDWGNHTLHFVLLSPVVGLLAIANGEAAVLKGAQKLRHLVVATFYTMLLVFVLTVPLYFFMGQRAIVPSLLLAALAQLVATIACSYRLFPPRYVFSASLLRKGWGMARMGIVLVMAGLMTSGSDFLVRAWLNNVSSLDTLGLYNAALMVTLTYGSMIFSSMDSDFYPRLSTAATQVDEQRMVNRQIEVMLLLITPFLVVFMLLLHFLLPLLFSGRFAGAETMMRTMMVVLLFRAVMIPMEYISLARGASKVFFVFEFVTGVLQLVGVVVGYRLGGLDGIGYGFVVATLVNVVIDLLIVRRCFAFVPGSTVLRLGGIMLLLCLGAWWVPGWSNVWAVVLVGVLLVVASGTLSLRLLSRRTNGRLWEKMRKRLPFH